MILCRGHTSCFIPASSVGALQSRICTGFNTLLNGGKKRSVMLFLTSVPLVPTCKFQSLKVDLKDMLYVKDNFSWLLQ